jgi:hypothetical protein
MRGSGGQGSYDCHSSQPEDSSCREVELVGWQANTVAALIVEPLGFLFCVEKARELLRLLCCSPQKTVDLNGSILGNATVAINKVRHCSPVSNL